LTACDIDVVTNSKNTVFAYAKIFKFIFIGMIATDNCGRWEVNKIHDKEGKIETKYNYDIPDELWGFIESKACLMQESQKKISAIQQKVIAKNILKNPRQYAASIGFKSALTDYQQCSDKQ
jgi:hypothetical protein